jgi:prenylcysteine oxidase/farnesylcysteine lyase
LDLPIYKVFSREPLDEELIGRVFARPAETTRVSWHAYPVLKPTAQWPPFRIAHGLYYANAMESAVSTMETEVVASRNVVQLLAQDICSASGVGLYGSTG